MRFAMIKRVTILLGSFILCLLIGVEKSYIRYFLLITFAVLFTLEIIEKHRNRTKFSQYIGPSIGYGEVVYAIIFSGFYILGYLVDPAAMDVFYDEVRVLGEGYGIERADSNYPLALWLFALVIGSVIEYTILNFVIGLIISFFLFRRNKMNLAKYSTTSHD